MADDPTSINAQLDQLPVNTTLLLMAKTSNIEMFMLQAAAQINDDVWQWIVVTEVLQIVDPISINVRM